MRFKDLEIVNRQRTQTNWSLPLQLWFSCAKHMHLCTVLLKTMQKLRFAQCGLQAIPS